MNFILPSIPHPSPSLTAALFSLFRLFFLPANKSVEVKVSSMINSKPDGHLGNTRITREEKEEKYHRMAQLKAQEEELSQGQGKVSF